MTHEERERMADIERDEQWLREHAPATPGPASLEHLKLQVRIAADEARLQATPTVSVDPACVARVKQAVRDELAGRPAGAARSRFRRLLALSIGGPLAAAAVVAMVVMVNRSPESSGSSTAYSALDALVEFAEEGETGRTDGVSLPNLDALEEEMQGFAWSAAAESGYDEAETETDGLYEKLRDELDSLKKPGTLMQAGEDYPWYAAGTIDLCSWFWPA